MITQEQINDKYFDKKMEFIDGYDNAIVGIDSVDSKVCYSISKLIEISMENGKTFDEAVNEVRYEIVDAKSMQFVFVDDIF
jgi:hypothetical protein